MGLELHLPVKEKKKIYVYTRTPWGRREARMK